MEFLIVHQNEAGMQFPVEKIEAANIEEAAKIFGGSSILKTNNVKFSLESITSKEGKQRWESTDSILSEEKILEGYKAFQHIRSREIKFWAIFTPDRKRYLGGRDEFIITPR